MAKQHNDMKHVRVAFGTFDAQHKSRNFVGECVRNSVTLEHKHRNMLLQNAFDHPNIQTL